MVAITTTGTLILDETSSTNTESDCNFSDLHLDFRTWLTANTTLANILEEAKGLTITVDPEGAAVSGLGFSKADGTAFSTSVGTKVVDTISGLDVKTISGKDVFLFAVAGDPDLLVAKDSDGALVAVFFLNDAANNLSASVEMVSFQALEHHDPAKGGGEVAGDQDLLDWGNVLSVTAQGSLEFNFNNLASGQFTWVAVGTNANGMIVTGSRLNIADDGTRGGSGKTASDSMNTSQGGDGATIGVDNQMFTPGDSAIFTFVQGFNQLPGTAGDATGQDIDQIVHNGYLNTGSAELLISQRQGNALLDINMSIFTAGLNGDDEDADGGAGGPYAPRGAIVTGSGNNVQVQKPTTFTDDAQPNILSVEIKQGATLVGIWTTDAAAANASNIDKIFFDNTPIPNGQAFAGVNVNITGNDALIENVDAGYSIKILADGTTFNRIELGSQTGNFDIGKFFIDQAAGDTDVIGDNIKTDDDRPALDGDNVVGHVDEDELTGASVGNTDSDLETTAFTYTHANLLTILTTGVDTPIHFSLDTTITGDVVDTSGATIKSKGVDVIWVNNGGVLEGRTDDVANRLVFTLQHNANGAGPTDDTFVFTLLDQIDHADAAGDNAERNINLTPAFNAADDDGDPVSGMDASIAIQAGVENDVPAGKNASQVEQVHEDALSGGNQLDGDAETKTVTATYTKAELSALVDIGADEDLSFTLNAAVIGTNVVTTGGTAVKSGGVNVVWAADGASGLKGIITVLGVDTTIFTLTPNGDNFDFTLTEQVDHGGADDDSELLALDLTPAFSAVDFDKDAVSLNADSVVMNVENDLPIFDDQIDSQTLDWVDDEFVTGSLHGKVGGDDAASYIIDKFTDLADYTETLSTDKKTLTYSKDGTDFFRLVLNDAANSGAGGYTFTVLAPPVDQPLELDFEDLDSGQNLFGTVAFDKTNIDNNGTPGNLTDDFLPDGGLLTFPSNPNINDGGAGESNDGSMTNASGTTNTSKGGGPVTIGNENQAFDHTDEGAWFCYVDNPQTDAVSGVGLNANLADDADNIQFDGMIGVKTASVELVQASGAGTTKRPGPAVRIEAWDLQPGTVNSQSLSRDFLLDPTASGDRANIVAIKIYDANGNLVEYRTNLQQGQSNGGAINDTDDPGDTVSGIGGSDDPLVGIQFVLIDDGGTAGVFTDDIYIATVNQLKQNYTIEWETEDAHTAALVQNTLGSYDIGGFNLLQGQDSADVDLEFSVGIEDEDGDVTHFAGTNDVFDDFRIKVDGTGVNNGPNDPPDGFTESYDTEADFLSLLGSASLSSSFVGESAAGAESRWISPLIGKVPLLVQSPDHAHDFFYA